MLEETSSREEATEATEELQKNPRHSENNETKDLPITVNMMHVTDNPKARKIKTYTDVIKQTKPLVLVNKSSHVNNKNGENQIDLQKIKHLLMKNEKLNYSRIATSSPKIINMFILHNLSDSFRKSRDFETSDTQDHELLGILEE